MTNPIVPNREQFAELMAAPDDGPVVMLNLLKFKEDGRGDYRRYGKRAVEMVEATGGRVLWTGRAEQVLIGDPDEDWDEVLLVQYPSRSAFIKMVSTPAYIEAHEYREAGLTRTVVIACSPRIDAVSLRQVTSVN